MIEDPVLLNDWYIVAATRDLTESEMLTARLWDEELVLWRHKGVVMVWKDYCVHRGAKLSPGRIKDGTVICPYHGWRYDATGRCSMIPAHPDLQPPARAQAISYRAIESDGFIWASLGNPENDPPHFPEYDEDSYRKVLAGPYNYHGNPFRTVENFLDVAHFPFVHANINGDPDNPEPIGDYEVFKNEFGIRTGRIPRFQPFGDHRGIPVTAYYQYNCPRPLSAYFEKDTGEGNRFCTFMAVTPLDIDDCILWVQIAINYGFDLPEPQILERQDAVYNQDKPIIESQRPHPMPLDLKEELHVRSDKYCVAYRRWLKELGVTWGVSQ